MQKKFKGNKFNKIELKRGLKSATRGNTRVASAATSAKS